MPRTSHNAETTRPRSGRATFDPVLDVRQVRGVLIMQGTSLAAWARAHGNANCGFIHQAISGRRRGPRAIRLLTQLRRDTGL